MGKISLLPLPGTISIPLILPVQSSYSFDPQFMMSVPRSLALLTSLPSLYPNSAQSFPDSVSQWDPIKSHSKNISHLHVRKAWQLGWCQVLPSKPWLYIEFAKHFHTLLSHKHFMGSQTARLITQFWRQGEAQWLPEETQLSDSDSTGNPTSDIGVSVWAETGQSLCFLIYKMEL